MSLDEYGGFRLQRGDFDLRSRPNGGHGRYQGTVFPGSLDPQFVTKLQTDLIAVGFKLVGNVDGDFGSKTEFALREFQIYAKMTFVALEHRSHPTYADRLRREANPTVYTGPISGQLNEDTAASLVAWRDGNFRCPVVVEARRVSRGLYDPATPPVHENVWNAREVINRRLRVLAVDFSERYDNSAPADFRDAHGRIKLGQVKMPTAGFNVIGGPASLAKYHSLASAEILPDSLSGKAWGDMADAETGTFRVIRAVSDTECSGVFDSLNAYDNAVMSVGPYHHIILLESGRRRHSRVSGGELGGYLAYLQKEAPAAYQMVLADNGLGFKPIVNGRINWRRDTAGRVYTALVKLQDSNGEFTIPVNTFETAEHLRGWHWFYRFSSAARTDREFRQGYWFMCRRRVWDILGAEWDGRIMEDSRNRQSRPLLIGDVFRSERAVALLLRFHVSLPSLVLLKGRASELVRWTVKAAGLENKTTDPRAWDDDDEHLLIDKLKEAVEKGYEVRPGVRVKKAKPWTVRNAEDIVTWPRSMSALYFGSRARSRLGGETDNEALKPLSDSREYGFTLHAPEWGAPPWG